MVDLTWLQKLKTDDWFCETSSVRPHQGRATTVVSFQVDLTLPQLQQPCGRQHRLAAACSESQRGTTGAAGPESASGVAQTDECEPEHDGGGGTV
eukprot:988689-Rhodomonas_salina.2